MRTHLMAGTALVAATMLAAGGAAAQDKKMMKPSISVNGYSDAGSWRHSRRRLGRQRGPRTPPALDVRSDAEIHFNGRGPRSTTA